MNTDKITQELQALKDMIFKLENEAVEARKVEQEAISRRVKIEAQIAQLKNSRRMYENMLND